MKIGNVELDGQPHEAVFPVPHRDQIIPFKARAISNFKKFNDLLPAPTPPGVLTKDGYKKQTDDPAYQAILTEYNNRRAAWIVIESLQDIEWDTVDKDQAATWCNWEDDLRNSGLCDIIISRIAAFVMEVNALDEGKLEKARAAFALGQAETAGESSGQSTEPESTPSGELASDSDSDPQE